eukprot:COSAG02_NODE_32698_length_512_cov_0.748184_1_plen_83_part_00
MQSSAVIGRRECTRARPPSSTHGHATTDPTRLTTNYSYSYEYTNYNIAKLNLHTYYRYLGTVNSSVCTHTRMNNYYPTNSNL